MRSLLAKAKETLEVAEELGVVTQNVTLRDVNVRFPLSHIACSFGDPPGNGDAIISLVYKYILYCLMDLEVITYGSR